MTAVAILATFLASMILYRFTSWDGYLFGMSFYVLTALSGLVAASAFAAISRNRRCIIGVGVLWLNFIGSHIAWGVGDDHYVLAQALDFFTAAYFVILGQTRWEWTVGGIFLASVGAGMLGMLGMLPPATGGFISLTFPYIAGFLGNLASAVLGLGAGDAGKRIRLAFRARPRWAPVRGMAG